MKQKYDYSLLVSGYKKSGIEFIKEGDMKARRRMGIFLCFCGKEREMGLGEFLKRDKITCICKNLKYPDVELGNIYFRLTVVSETYINKGQSYVDVKCSCGKEKSVRCNPLKSGELKSCGCYNIDMLRKPKTHGLSRTPLHKLWLKMRDKCTNSNSETYHNYGGRGVIICGEWNDFINFHNWAMANGYKKGLQLDKDILYREKYGTLVGMEYSPEYCQFVTSFENNQCKSTSRYIEYDGRSQTLTQWAAEFNIHSHTLSNRLDKMNWDIDKALTTRLAGKSPAGFVPYKDKRVGRVHKKRIKPNNNEKTSI